MASTWTAPRTWTVGETVTKVILDTHVRDNLSWLRDASVATYDTFTVPVTVSATTEATAGTVKASTAYTFDGATTATVEIFTPELILDNQRVATFVLLYDTTVLGVVKFDASVLANLSYRMPVFLSFPSHTPASGSHTYTWKAFTSAGTYDISAGAGGSGVLLPGYIRVRLSAL